MGRLIPAGTGMDRYTSLQIAPDGPPAYEDELPMGAMVVEGAPDEPDLDTDRFAEMIRAAAAAASASEPGQAS